MVAAVTSPKQLGGKSAPPRRGRKTGRSPVPRGQETGQVQKPANPSTPAVPAIPVLDDAFTRLQQAASEAATSPHNDRRDPTEAQARAGNYKKARVTIHGLPLVIENVRNSVRSGLRADGTVWSSRMAAHYGEVAGTRGADGDPVDVFVGHFPESPSVWVINQAFTTGGFDEHKVMLGFATEAQARAAYTDSFDRDWTGLQSMVAATADQLKWWLKHGDMRRPLSQDQLPFDGQPAMTKTLWNADAEPVSTPMHRLMYALRTDDGPHGLLLDAVSLDELLADPDVERLPQPMLDALVVPVSRMTQRMDQLQRVMDAAGGLVKTSGYTVSDPIRARGVMQVAVLFALSDGQAVTIWFHNPDTTPAKLTPMDELVSWKWMLNKRDITIVVAPERGRELNPREVARRIMRLAERNSEAFKKANAKLADKLAELSKLDDEVADLTVKLWGLQRKIAVAKQRKQDTAVSTERQIRSRTEEMNKLLEMIEAAKRIPNVGDVSGSGQSLQALMDQYDDMADEIRALRGEAQLGRSSWAQWLGLQEVKVAREANGGNGLDVNNPDDYARILASLALQLAYQDTTDSLFAERIIAVRNALRELGWEGESMGVLSRNDAKLEMDTEHTGAGNNVYGVRYRVTGNVKSTAIYGADGLRDDLGATPAALAALIDAEVSPWSPEETEARRTGDWKTIYTTLPLDGKFRVAGVKTLNPISPSYATDAEAEAAAAAFFSTGEFPAPAEVDVGQPADDFDDDEPGVDDHAAVVAAAVEAARQGAGGITRILTSAYFTFEFDGEDLVLSDELRAEVEAVLGESLVEAVFPGLEGEIALVPTSAAPAKPANLGPSNPKRVTKKEARTAYDALSYRVSDLQGHSGMEFARADVSDLLAGPMAAVQALVERGWPDVQSADGVLAAAQALLDRWTAARADGSDGMPDSMGRGDAITYLRHKGLTDEQAAPILAAPTGVNISGDIEVPSYTRANFDEQAAAVLAPVPQDVERAEVGAKWTRSTTVERETWMLRTSYARGGQLGLVGKGVLKLAWDSMRAETQNKLLAAEVAVVPVAIALAADQQTAIEGAPEMATEDEQAAESAADRAYLNSLIEGTGDLLAEDTFTKLEPMFSAYESNTEMMALLERAAQAYGDAAQVEAQKALALN